MELVTQVIRERTDLVGVQASAPLSSPPPVPDECGSYFNKLTLLTNGVGTNREQPLPSIPTEFKIPEFHFRVET